MATPSLALSGKRCVLSTADDRLSFFRNELGEVPGKGRVLVTRADLNGLDRDALHTLVWADEQGRSAALYNLVLPREPECLSPDAVGDSNAAYEIQLADRRHLCHNQTFSASVNAHFNVRMPVGSATTYYPSTLNSGTPWKWSEILAYLWGLMPVLGAFPSMPVMPDGTPENWQFIGASAWQALCRVLKRIGCAVKADLSLPSNQFSIVQIGAADPTTDSLLTAAESRHSKLHDAEFQTIIRGEISYGVAVTFFRRDLAPGAPPWPPNSAYTVNVVGPDAATAEPGIYTPIYDDLPALYDAAGALTNGAALGVRANERAADFYRMQKAGGSRLLKTYSGVVPLSPGPTIKVVVYRLSKEGGLVTDVVRHPLPSLFDPTRCCDATLSPLPQSLPTPAAPPAATVSVPLSGDTNNVPVGPGVTEIAVTPTASGFNLTGVTGAAPGQPITVVNTSTTFTFNLPDNSGSSTQPWLTTPGKPVTVAPGESVTFITNPGATTLLQTAASIPTPVLETLTMTGTTNNQPITPAAVSTLVVTPNAGGYNLTGLTGGTPGQTVVVVNGSATNPFSIPNNSGSSTTPFLTTGGGTATLAPGMVGTFTLNPAGTAYVQQSASDPLNSVIETVITKILRFTTGAVVFDTAVTNDPVNYLILPGTGSAAFANPPPKVGAIAFTNSGGVFTGWVGVATGSAADWKQFYPATASGALLVANNLSDLASASTARTNLGVPSGSGSSTGTNTGDQTVFGRSGNITAATGDYTAAQVTNAADITIANTFNATTGQTVKVTHSSATGIVYVLTVSRTQTAASNAFSGIGIKLTHKSDTTNDRLLGDINGFWVTAADLTRRAQMRLRSAQLGSDTLFHTCINWGTTAADAPGLGFFAAALAPSQTGDIGTALVTFGLMTGTPTFAAANLTGTVTNAQLAGGIDLATKVTGVLPFANAPLTTDVVANRSGTNQALTQSAWNTIVFNTESTDALNEYDPTTGTFTPSVTGLYDITCFYTAGGATTRTILAVWTGTASELQRLADGTLTLCGGRVPVQLTAATGYTFRAFPLDAGVSATLGAALTFLRIRRLS